MFDSLGVGACAPCKCCASAFECSNSNIPSNPHQAPWTGPELRHGQRHAEAGGGGQVRLLAGWGRGQTTAPPPPLYPILQSRCRNLARALQPKAILAVSAVRALFSFWTSLIFQCSLFFIWTVVSLWVKEVEPCRWVLGQPRSVASNSNGTSG